MAIDLILDVGVFSINLFILNDINPHIRSMIPAIIRKIKRNIRLNVEDIYS
jgi:hypothetical protein